MITRAHKGVGELARLLDECAVTRIQFEDRGSGSTRQVLLPADGHDLISKCHDSGARHVDVPYPFF